MTTLVGLNIVIAAVLAVLALLCATASVTLERNAALAWVAGALVIGTLQTLIITFAPETALDFVSAALLAPLGFLMASESVAALVPGLPGRMATIVGVTFLSALAIILAWAEAPFPAQALAFEVACVLAMFDASWRVRFHRRHSASLLVRGLAIVVHTLTALTLLRLAMLPVHFGPQASFLTFSRSPAEALFLGVASLLSPIIIILLLALIISETIQKFQRQSEHDSLTGLFNRRMIDAMTGRTGRPGAVIFCDIDHFKQVNDRFGHEAGDAVICNFAALLEDTGHVAGRIGGEEFALLLPGWTAQEAAEVAEDIRTRFHALEQDALVQGMRLSASFGVAEHRANEAVRKAFRRADAALYEAKAAGRNQVVIHNPTAPLPETGYQAQSRAA